MPYLSLAAAALVWGGSFVAGRALVALTDPLAIAWARFAVASVAFLILEAAERRGGAPRGRGDSGFSAGSAAAAPSPARPAPAWYDYALLGLSGIFAYNLFFFYGLTYTTATESSLLIAASPVVVALLGLAFLGEKLSWRKSSGMILSVAGVALVILGAAAAAGGTVAVGSAGSGAAGGRLFGDLLMLGGVFSWAAYSVLGKKVLDRVSPLVATARATYWGLLFFTLPVVARYGPGFIFRVFTVLSPHEYVGLLYLSLVCTVFGFVAWYRGLSAVEVSRASVFLNLVPLSTLVIAAISLGERPTLIQLLGGAMVVGGVMVVSRSPSPGLSALAGGTVEGPDGPEHSEGAARRSPAVGMGGRR